MCAPEYCSALSDAELIAAIESCTLEAEFHHADHIRLAWIYLRAMPEPQAAQRMCETINRFAAHKGKAERYHHTITLAWIRLVSAVLRTVPASDSFLEFISANPHLCNQQTLARHYSQQLLDSPAARAQWVAPDRAPLPGATLCKEAL